MSDGFGADAGDLQRLTVALGQLPATLRRLVGAAVKRAGANLKRAVDYKLGPGGILEPRTGNLRRALFSRYDETPTTFAATVGFDLGVAPYARVQEQGGTITPKNAAHLTIPIGEALTGNGVARFTARELIADPFQFGFSGSFAAKGVLFGVVQGAGILPLFALKPSVTLPARAPLATSLADGRAAAIADISAQAVQGLTPDLGGGA